MKDPSLGDWQRLIVHDMRNPLAVIPANPDLLASCRRRAAGSGPEGTGLGPAFCRLACGLHGGRMGAEEESADGTVVHVELPMNPAPSGSGLRDGPKEDQTGDDHGSRRS